MDYRYIKLGDCLSLITNGFVVKQSRDTDKAGGYPFTRIETLSNGRFNRDRMGYADIYDLKGLESFVLEDEDIIISHINSRRFLGRSVLYKKIGDEIILHGMNVLRIKTNLDILNPVYANYFFQTEYYKQCIDNIRKDAINQSSFSIGDFQKLVIPLPEIEYQEKIADVLSSLDRKIALNRAINRNLEALAKQLYDYWFVQFDFPDENGRPYKSSGGKMVWNEVLKRDVPEGWEVKRLGDVIRKLSSGKRPKGGIDKALKDGIPSLGAECIDDLGVFDYGSTPYLPFSYRDSITTGIIENKDILVYKDGAYVGKTTLFQDGFPFKFACVNEHVFLIHAKDEDLQEYLLFTLKNPTYYEMMQKFGKAKAAQPGLNQDDICSISFLAPETAILKKFRERVEASFHLIFSQSIEIAALTRQRDELLPLLMNGQVTIE